VLKLALKIIADSCCDLPLSYLEENNVRLLPLKVHLDDQEFDDHLEIEPSTVYQAIRDGQLPKTAQVSPHLFKEVFTEMAKNNEDGIYISLSSQLSGTYSTAVMILDQVKEDYPEFNLTIIDTKCVSLGLGLLVQEAVLMMKENKVKEDLVNNIKFRAEHMESLFTVEDLEHLAKGGRVSKASAFLGGLLNIKPLLNVEEGKLVPLEKHRGKKKLLRRIIELMHERGVSLDQQVIGISHADDEQTALDVKQMFEQEFSPQKIEITEIGAVIGAHTGPGTIAIFFLNKMPS
jgi:DegV family protein with EDD domain